MSMCFEWYKYVYKRLGIQSIDVAQPNGKYITTKNAWASTTMIRRLSYKNKMRYMRTTVINFSKESIYLCVLCASLQRYFSAMSKWWWYDWQKGVLYLYQKKKKKWWQSNYAIYLANEWISHEMNANVTIGWVYDNTRHNQMCLSIRIQQNSFNISSNICFPMNASTVKIIRW